MARTQRKTIWNHHFLMTHGRKTANAAHCNKSGYYILQLLRFCWWLTYTQGAFFLVRSHGNKMTVSSEHLNAVAHSEWAPSYSWGYWVYKRKKNMYKVGFFYLILLMKSNWWKKGHWWTVNGLINHTSWEPCKRCRQIIPFSSAHASWSLSSRHCEVQRSYLIGKWGHAWCTLLKW